MASACLACVVQPARASHQQAWPQPCADVQEAPAAGRLCCNCEQSSHTENSNEADSPEPASGASLYLLNTQSSDFYILTYLHSADRNAVLSFLVPIQRSRTLSISLKPSWCFCRMQRAVFRVTETTFSFRKIALFPFLRIAGESLLCT